MALGASSTITSLAEGAPQLELGITIGAEIFIYRHITIILAHSALAVKLAR